MSKYDSARIWMPILGFEDSHEVSNYGEVRTKERVFIDVSGKKRNYKSRDLKPTKKSNGYYHLTLNYNNQQKTMHIHRMVLEAFVGSCPSGMEALHKDNNRSNNTLENLRWGTHKENCIERSEKGGHGHVINFAIAQKIREKKGRFKQKEIAKEFNVSPTLVRLIHNNKVWTIKPKGASL